MVHRREGRTLHACELSEEVGLVAKGELLDALPASLRAGALALAHAVCHPHRLREGLVARRDALNLPLRDARRVRV